MRSCVSDCLDFSYIQGTVMLKLEPTDAFGNAGERVVVSDCELVADQRTELEDLRFIFGDLGVNIIRWRDHRGKMCLTFPQGLHQIKAMESLVRVHNDEARAEAYAVDGEKL